jgi:uroporphyrinogen decarboxylase
LTDEATMLRRARKIIEEGRALPGHIFNLGHGIYPDTPLERVEALVNFVKGAVEVHG